MVLPVKSGEKRRPYHDGCGLILMCPAAASAIPEGESS